MGPVSDCNLVFELGNVSVPPHTITVSKLTMIFRVEGVFYRIKFQIKLFLDQPFSAYSVLLGFRQVSMDIRS